MTLTQNSLGDVLMIGLTAEALGLATERPSRGQAETLQRILDRVFV